MNQFKNNIQASARLGPKVGLKNHAGFIQRIKPLYFLSEKEVSAYAFLKGFMDKFSIEGGSAKLGFPPITTSESLALLAKVKMLKVD